MTTFANEVRELSNTTTKKNIDVMISDIKLSQIVTADNNYDGLRSITISGDSNVWNPTEYGWKEI